MEIAFYAVLIRRHFMDAIAMIRSSIWCASFGGAVLVMTGPLHSADFLEIADQREVSECLITLKPAYTGELFSNTRGGKSTNDATQYQGLLDLAFAFDLKGGDNWRRGRLFLLAQNTHGRGLTQDFVGDTQVISNIDSFDNIMRVGEYGWESDWLDDQLRIRVGKQDFNSEFQHMELADDFVQSTFGLSPSTAFPTYPNQAMGAVALLKLYESIVLKSGLWSAFANGGSWGISQSDSFLVVGELERDYALASGALDGVVSIGAVYESEGDLDGRLVAPVHEYFVQVEQMIYRECPFDDACRQGTSVFAGYYPRFPGPQPLSDSIGDSAVAGVVCRGLLSSRDEDVLGVGVAWSELFQGGTNQEIVSELFYRIGTKRRMFIQPDVQYVSSPSGIFRDALVVGVRFVLQP